MTGPSRSGTKYAAKLWSQIGYRCGHEAVFNIFKVSDRAASVGEFPKFHDVDGDSSFLAAPLLGQLPEDTVIFHQVRDPLEVIRSHLGIGFFADPIVPSVYLADNHTDFVDYVGRHCPEVLAERGEAGRCMRYWVCWNKLIENTAQRAGFTYVRYRLEDVDTAVVRSLVGRLNDDIDDATVESALASVTKRTNSRARDESVSWPDLPEGDAKDLLLETAHHYGYIPTGIR